MSNREETLLLKKYLKGMEELVKTKNVTNEILAEAIVKLSSVFVNRQPLRGFTDTETETKYLSTLLDVGPEDREWSRYVRRFWAELRIPVGFAGMELEVGKDQDGDQHQREQKGCSTTGMFQRIGGHNFGSEFVACFKSIDGLVFGTVVCKNPLHIGHPTNDPDISNQ